MRFDTVVWSSFARTLLAFRSRQQSRPVRSSTPSSRPAAIPTRRCVTAYLFFTIDPGETVCHQGAATRFRLSGTDERRPVPTLAATAAAFSFDICRNTSCRNTSSYSPPRSSGEACLNRGCFDHSRRNRTMVSEGEHQGSRQLYRIEHQGMLR
jgi:hypothetical protein